MYIVPVTLFYLILNPSEYSLCPFAHPRSLISVFADGLWFLQPPGYSKMDKREALPYRVDI